MKPVAIPARRASDIFAGLSRPPALTADSLRVDKDEVGLYVRLEEWVYRPRQATGYTLGDAVPLAEKPGSIIANVGTETWVRCGHFARGVRAQDNARFFMALAERA